MNEKVLEFCGLNDVYFKKLVHDNKEVIVRLLKGICNLEVDSINDIEFQEVEGIDELSLKTTRFDVNIKILNTRIDIESENSRHGDTSYYDNRKIYYLSRLHSSSYPDKINYNKEYRSYVIFIYNFDIGYNNLISESYMYNKGEKYIYPQLRIYDVCLPRINKSSTLEIENLLDLLSSKNITTYTNSKNGFLKEVADMITIYDEDEIMRLRAQKRQDDLNDYYSGLEWAEIKGRKESKIETAKNMLKDGMSLEMISKYTGLSLEEIKTLK